MKNEATKVSGGCLCEDIRYEAEVFLKGGSYCHCRICQKSSGAPAEIGIPIKAGSLRFIKGEPTYYQTSEYGKRGFCGNCGSRVLWKAVDPAYDWCTNVSVGSLDTSADARPSNHIYTNTQLPWYQVADSLPKYRREDMEQVMKVWQRERNIT